MKGLNTPFLRFKGYFENWSDAVLNEFLSFNNGINADKDSYGHGRKFINVLDILNNNSIQYEDIIGAVSVNPQVEESNRVEYGDLLFLRSSETREDIGKSSVYLDKDNFALFGGFVIRGKMRADYDPYFLKLNLESSNVRNQISSKAGGSTRFNVSQSVLSTVEIKVPILDEQQKIADFFTLLDRRIEKQQEKVEAWREYKKGMMQKLFSQELRFRDEDGREFPAWTTVLLNALCWQGKAGGTPKSTVPNYYNGDIPFLSISDMTEQGKYITYTDRSISKLGLENSSAWIVPRDSLIFSMYASIGKVAINKMPLATSQAMYSMVINENLSTTEYLYQYLNYFKDIGIRRLIETGTQGNLNAESVRNIPIAYPRPVEQQKIAHIFSTLDQKIEGEVKKLNYLRKQKQGFMQQMFI